jgi:hypothetical protein
LLGEPFYYMLYLLNTHRHATEAMYCSLVGAVWAQPPRGTPEAARQEYTHGGAPPTFTEATVSVAFCTNIARA